jgi:hypothetical protein
VKHWYNPRTWAYPRAYGALVALTIFMFLVFVAYDKTNRNKTAIEKSCTLLNNAIIKSTQAQAQPDSPGAILIAEILRTAPSDVKAQYQTAVENSSGGASDLLIDCKQVADHPEDIHPQKTQP